MKVSMKMKVNWTAQFTSMDTFMYLIIFLPDIICAFVDMDHMVYWCYVCLHRKFCPHIRTSQLFSNSP